MDAPSGGGLDCDGAGAERELRGFQHRLSSNLQEPDCTTVSQVLNVFDHTTPRQRFNLYVEDDWQR